MKRSMVLLVAGISLLFLPQRRLLAVGVSPDTLSFGSVTVGDPHLPSTKTLFVTITNSSPVDTVDVVSVVSTDPAFVPGDTSFSLPPGSQRQIPVTFTPASVDSFEATISIGTNEVLDATYQVYARGRGIAAPSPISGVWTVGSGGDFPTLKQALDSINTSYLLDTLRLVLTDLAYDEPPLRLQPAALMSPAKPLIIASSSSTPAVVNVAGPDSLTSIAFSIVDAGAVDMDNLHFVLDTADTPFTGIGVSGDLRSLSMSQIDLNGGNASIGLSLSCDSAAIVVSGGIFHEVLSAIAGSFHTLSIRGSEIDHWGNYGIYVDSAAQVVVDSCVFDGNDSAYVGIGGVVTGSWLEIQNSRFSRYRGFGINRGAAILFDAVGSTGGSSDGPSAEGLSTPAEEPTPAHVGRGGFSHRQTPRTRDLSFSEAIHTLTTVKILRNGFQNLSSGGVYLRGVYGGACEVEIGGNTLSIFSDVGAAMGIWISECVSEAGMGRIRVHSNDVETNRGGSIFLDRMSGTLQTEIVGNTVRDREGNEGEVEILLSVVESMTDGSTLRIDSNRVSGSILASEGSQIPGAMSVSDNELTRGGIIIPYAMAATLNVERNLFNDFGDAGIFLESFELFEEEIMGGVRLVGNSILGSDSTTGHDGGMFLGLIFAHYLVIDSNVIGGTFEGFGILAEGLSCPGALMGENGDRWEVGGNGPESLHERVAHRLSQAKMRGRSGGRVFTQTKERRERKEEGTPSHRVKNGANLLGSELSVRGNRITHRGGDAEGLVIYDTEGPVTVTIAGNVLAPFERIETGLFLGESLFPRQVEIMGNTVRNVDHDALYIGQVRFETEDADILVRDNDIQLLERGSGIYLEDVLFARRLEVAGNRVAGVDPTMGEAISIVFESDAAGNTIRVDSNDVSGFEYGLFFDPQRCQNIQIRGNTLHGNKDGMFLGVHEESPPLCTVLGNVARQNLERGMHVNTDGLQTPLILRFNTIVDNDSLGLVIEGDGPPPFVEYNNIARNTDFSLWNYSPVSIHAQHNWWGPATTAEMDSGSYPKNISAIYDSFDNANRGFVDYGEWEHDSITVSYGTIGGTVFNDIDGDCLRDAGEPGQPNRLVRLMPGDLYATTNEEGLYGFDYVPYGTYTLTELPTMYWQQNCPPPPGSIPVNLEPGQTLTGRDFGNQVSSWIRDFHITTAGGIARPGFRKSYGISYGNTGTLDANATVTFVHPPNTTVVPGSFNPPYSGYDPGSRTVTWNLGTLAAGTSGEIRLAVQIATPPTVNNGDTLVCLAAVLPFAGDEDTTDNAHTEWQIVRGSFDPNDKREISRGIDTLGFVPYGTELLYQIRFQNTGTDTAFTAVIKDTLDPHCDLSTFVQGGSSHLHSFSVGGNRVLTWVFDGINLPDSNVNEEASHGFVSFRVRPRHDAPVGMVQNRAGIFFDYQLPVLTNLVRIGFISDQSVVLQGGWNLVSLAGEVTNDSVGVVYPGRLSSAYRYVPDTGYQVSPVFVRGFGYWLKFGQADTVTVTGLAVGADTVGVSAGWNLVGSISASIPSAAVASVPPGIIMSPFFSYGRLGYEPAGTIDPGHGYWVKAGTAGSLILSAMPAAHPPQQPSITSASWDRFNSISFTDGVHRTQLLFFVDRSSDSLSMEFFEMPPAAPAGNFDVRFASNRILESTGRAVSGVFPIVVTSAQFPLRLTWDVKDAEAMASLLIGTQELPLKGRGSSVVADAGASIALKLGAQQSVPREFELEQNYPNPFNPTTTLRYALPVLSHVSLRLYNILGQEVKTLIDGVQEAGYRTVEWNATNNFGKMVGSGVYFCRLQAGDFVQTRKMLLVR